MAEDAKPDRPELSSAPPEERAPIYHEAFRILNADINSLNLYWPEMIVAYASAPPASQIG